MENQQEYQQMQYEQPQYQQMQYEQPQYQQMQYNQPQYQQMQYSGPQYQQSQGQYVANLQQAKPFVQQNITYNQQGMKWYLFMIWGYLIFLPIAYFLNAIDIFSQASQFSRYFRDEEAELMAAFMNVAAIIMIGLGVYSLYTRKQLIEFRSHALTSIKIMLIAPIIIAILFLLLLSLIFDGDIGEIFEAMIESDAGTVYLIVFIIDVIFIVGNISYFSNRKHLFVN